MQDTQFYVLTTIDSERHHRMKMRFQHENINTEYCGIVPFHDHRLVNAPEPNKRSWSCMFGHLDMFRRFLDSSSEYGIFCEDDIHIRRGMNEIIPEAIAKYERHNLEIMMLGYLFPFKPVELSFYHEPEFYHQKLDIIDENLIYFTYIDRLWGSQMYMLNRATAKRFLTTYTLEYAMNTLTNQNITPFAVDWTITKDGRRLAVYPLLALEERRGDSGIYGQDSYHIKCHDVHYDSEKYI